MWSPVRSFPRRSSSVILQPIIDGLVDPVTDIIGPILDGLLHSLGIEG